MQAIILCGGLGTRLREMVYDVPKNNSSDTYKIKSEFSQIETDTHQLLIDKSEVSGIKSASDCKSFYIHNEIKPLGNTEKPADKKSIDAFAEITPFMTAISLPGYDDYDIEVTDQDGNIINKMYESIYEP